MHMFNLSYWGKGTGIESLELFTFFIEFILGYSVEIMTVTQTTVIIIILIIIANAYIVPVMDQALS